MRLPLTLLLVVLLGTCARAQLLVTGQVINQNGEQPIEFATVLVNPTNGTEAAVGTTTDLEGKFSVETTASEVTVEISFIGFTTLRLDAIDKTKADLGTIRLSSASQQLEEVTVRAEKSQTEFRLDKRVFNVGKDLSSTGAGALEVLNNVPSVNVTIEGQVQLRGSGGVQILIDGKPSVIASDQGNLLGTITADMIESVEVITNPSAKYDAEGTSGIINIVLKKEEKKGLNGAISVNGGTPDNYSVGLSLNRRTEKWNLFSQLGVGYRELPNEEETRNTNLTTGTSIFGDGKEFRNERYYNVVLGTDYHVDERNVITLSGNFAYEIEDQPSAFTFEQLATGGDLLSRWEREEVTEATNPKYQFELQYKRDFKDHKDHDLLFSALGSLFQKDQSSEFANVTLAGTDRDGRQQTRTNFGQTDNTLKLDYTRPINEKITLETGAQYVSNDVSNDFSVSDFVGGDFVVDPDLTNVFNWTQRVTAAYGTWAYEPGDWGIKLGLRVENTNVVTLLETTEQRDESNYTNLFPSGHASYKVSEAISFQGGYSRRIFRPRLWDLNPFFNPRNAFNIRVGNPDLQPEFTDSYEVTGIWIGGVASFNAGIYHRFTTEVVERITRFEGEVAITQPLNIGTNRSTGLEVNAKVTPAKWLTLTGDFNYNTFAREGELEGTSFDFSADQYNGRVTSKFDLPQDIDFEVTGQYQSGFQTVQGEQEAMAWLDLGLRKRLFKGRGALNLSVRDLFASRVRESIVESLTFSQYRRNLRGRFVTLGFSF
ncbi:MAG: outer membrane beta-barrel family protein, partial [Bacteroidota bacterium]